MSTFDMLCKTIFINCIQSFKKISLVVIKSVKKGFTNCPMIVINGLFTEFF